MMIQAGGGGRGEGCMWGQYHYSIIPGSIVTVAVTSLVPFRLLPTHLYSPVSDITAPEILNL